mmetsp:Transcript_1499/g.1698  ORF Transcript_1499/g.1698 Transcript_1499/m.1698 type:complete len:182 (-) Transcript_1499:415-960(-)
MQFAERRLGKKRVRGAYAWSRILKEGANGIAFGSDWPTVGKVPPLLGVYAAITRKDLNGSPLHGWYADECVTRTVALKGYSFDAAFAAFREHDFGTLDTNMFADFIVLDRDITDHKHVPDADIWRTQILGTFVGGERVWKHPCWGVPYKNANDTCTERKVFVEKTFERFTTPGRVDNGCPH